MMLLKCCTQCGSKSGKHSNGYRTGKGQFSFQSQRRQCQRMFKLLHNCTHFTCQQGNAQNPSSQASTVCELRTSRCRSVQAGSEIKLSTPTGSQKKQGNSRKASTSALLTMFHKCQKFVIHWCKINILLDFSLICLIFQILFSNQSILSQ